MQLSQKTKYFVCGVIVTVILIPLAIKAVDSVPLQFREGDVISAGVINSLLGRINKVQKGFNSVDDLNGTWSCTVYDTSAFGTNTCTSDGPILSSKTGLLTFNSTNKTWSWSGAGSLNDCGSGLKSTGSYDVKAGILVTDIGVYDTRFRGENEFIWFITNSMPPSGFNLCTKVTNPPLPPNNLTYSVSGTSITLTWVDQSTDETGFKVQRKTSAKGTWTDVSTTAANATSYTDNSLAAGPYWYRVLASNSYGDSISSSEVQVTVQ